MPSARAATSGAQVLPGKSHGAELRQRVRPGRPVDEILRRRGLHVRAVAVRRVRVVRVADLQHERIREVAVVDGIREGLSPPPPHAREEQRNRPSSASTRAPCSGVDSRAARVDAGQAPPTAAARRRHRRRSRRRRGSTTARSDLDRRGERARRSRVVAVARERRPGGNRLDAAALSARALLAVGVDDEMPDLAGEPMRAPEDLAADDDAAADAGAHRDVRDRFVRASGCIPLGERSGIRVVRDRHRRAVARRAGRRRARPPPSPGTWSETTSSPSTRPPKLTPTASTAMSPTSSKRRRQRVPAVLRRTRLSGRAVDVGPQPRAADVEREDSHFSIRSKTCA